VNRIYVDLAPEGSRRPLRLLLDTGASFSLLTPGAARAAGVHVRRDKNDPYRRGTRLGRDLQFYVDARRGDTASRTGWEYGLLGANFLSEYVVELDFEARRVRFLDPERFAVAEAASAEGEAVLPLSLVGGRPGLRVEIGGERLDALIDTGSPFGLMLSGEQAGRLGVRSRAVSGFGLEGVLGAIESEIGEVEDLALGPIRLGRLPVTVAPQGWYNQAFSGGTVLGYDVLASFRVRIDYPRRRLWLRRRPQARATLLGVDYTYPETGALLVPDRDGYRVLQVREGSVAAARGLAAGQHLTAPPDLASDGGGAPVAASPPEP